MGFRLGRTYLLEFDKNSYLGEAEVRLKWASIATIEQVEQSSWTDGWPIFLDHVVDWNLETEDGVPIDPHDLDKVNHSMEPSVRRALIGEWLKVAYGTSAPLDKPSSDGVESLDTGSEELSIPMELSSKLPANMIEHSSS